MPTTEIMTCALKPGSAIGDADNEASKILKETLQTISQQDGCLKIHFGMQVESPHVLQLMIEWSSLDSHKTFMAQDYYKPFERRFMTIGDAIPQFAHVDFKPDGALSRTFTAPVTEVATFYFDGGSPDDYVDKALQFADLLEKEQAEGYLGASVGTTHEEIEREGVKGKGAVLTVGWSSVDAHMKFRTTDLFKNNIQLLRQGASKIEMHHVQFLPFATD